MLPRLPTEGAGQGLEPVAVDAFGTSAVSPSLQGLWKKYIKHLQHKKLLKCVRIHLTYSIQVLMPEEAEEDSRSSLGTSCLCASVFEDQVPLMPPLPPGFSHTACSLFLPCCLCHGHATPSLPFHSVLVCSLVLVRTDTGQARLITKRRKGELQVWL